MNTEYLTVIIIAFTVVLMWIGYVQVLNHLIDKEERLKYEALPKCENTPAADKTKKEKIQGKINTIIRIQKLLIYQCLIFALVVALSLIWLWLNLKQVGGLFSFILGVFTFTQVIHFVAFWYSYKGRLCSNSKT